MINYKLKKSYRKTLSLQVRDGELIVKAPYFTMQRTIINFIQKHEEWIKKMMNRESIKTKNRKTYSQAEILELKQKARDYITNKVGCIAFKYGLKYNSIKITSAKARWGSCTSKKNLNFSYRLILTPKEIIDYVIVHELSHLKEMNHSKKFWSEIERIMPDYKKHDKWLKDNSHKF